MFVKYNFLNVNMNFFELAMVAGTIILIAFALQLFVYSKGNKLLNKLLAVLFLSRAIQNIFFILVHLKLIDSYLIIISIIPIAIFVAPPALYLYIRSFLNDHSRLKPVDLLHLIPVFLIVINLIPFLSASSELKLTILNAILLNNKVSLNGQLLFIPIKIQFLLRSVILLIYLIFSWKIFLTATSDKTKAIVSIEKYYLFTLLALVTFQVIISLGTSIYLVFYAGVSYSMNFFLYKPLTMLLFTVLIYLFIFWILRHPEILYGNLLATVEKSEAKPQVEILAVKTSEGDSQHESKILLSESQVLYYIEQLKRYVEEDRLYLNPDLNIQMLSELSSIPVHHCSYIINHVLKKSFREYVNSLRIKYYIDTFVSHRRDRFTIEYQSDQIGFKNQGTFNRCFKIETGMTPKEYTILNYKSWI